MSASSAGFEGAGKIKGRILLVEDDALSLKLMKDALEAFGHEVSQASSGPEGLSTARAWLPDVIVMDIGLPGTDGVKVTQTLKESPAVRRVPVVAVTAYAMPADEDRMLSAGCDVFLTKPLRLLDFVKTVEGLLVRGRVDPV